MQIFAACLQATFDETGQIVTWQLADAQIADWLDIVVLMVSATDAAFLESSEPPEGNRW